MNIHELDSFNLADTVKFHPRLNPALWGKDEHLLPEVREKLLAIAADFQEFLGVKDLNVKDITVSGSNAAYSYTPNSDIDLHLVVDMPADPVYQELFNAKKYQYNDEHNISIGGADVELYVQPADQKHHSQGIYSVKNNSWLQVPRRKRADVDDSCVRAKAEDLDARIHNAIKSQDVSTIGTLWNKIKTMRQTGLEKEGEFGCDNLAFKVLRNSGCIKALKDAKTAAEDRELSLREQNRPKQRKIWGFSEGHQGSPLSSEDGVAPSTCMFLNEEEPSDSSIVTAFIDWVAGRIGIENMPEIVIHDTPEWSTEHHSFGMYEPEEHRLNVSMPNRHLLDVLRTTAHELVHCRQNELHKLPAEAGLTGSKWENEANAQAGIIMRDFADAHPEYFDNGPLKEASGYIPTKKQANDPRYKMALTVDVHPGQTGKEANKMALKTDKQGRPALLMKTANLLESEIAAEFAAFAEGKSYGYNSTPLSQVPGEREDELGNQEATGPEFPPEMPAGTTKIDVSDLTDWYRLGQDISDLDDADPEDYNQGPPQTVIVFPSDEAEQGYLKQFKRLGLKTHDMDPDVAGGEDIYGKHMRDLAEAFEQLEEQFLGEVKMTSGNLAKLAKDIPGVKVGLEFEMIVPNARVEDDGDMEPDYEQDQRVRDIDDAVNFFDDGDYNSRNELRRLREAMESDFFDWQHEKIDELWNSNDGWEFFTNYLDREDPFDEDEAREEATNELQAQYGDDITPEEFQTMLNDLVEEKSKEYYQEQWDEQGRNYDYAREEFEEEQRDNLTEEDWLDSQGIRYASDVESQYGYVSWPYYTSGSDGEETDIERIALDFMNGIGADSVAYSSSYHGSYKKWVGNGWVLVGSEKPDDCFSIEPDGSLDGNSSDDVGLEFVSPPTPLEEIPDLMKRVQSWAADNGVYTGKRNKTSIHTNISVPGYDLDKLDYLKAALLLGDEYVLREFDRIGNTYAAPAIEKVKQLVQQKPEKAQELLDKMKSQLNAAASKLIHSGQTNKFTSINTKNNRVEFRSPGGDYLSIIADNPQKMVDTINRMVVTLDAAMDPNKYKQEYQKKLYKVLTGQGGGREAKSGLKQAMKASDKDLLNIFSRYAAGELPKAALKSFVRQAQLERSVAKGKQTGKMWWNVQWDANRRMEVVAGSADVAKQVAAEEWGVPEDRLAGATVTPLRPYKEGETTQQPEIPGSNIYRITTPGGTLIAGDEYDNDQAALRRAQYWAQHRNTDVVVRNARGEEVGRVSSIGDITPAAPASSTQFGAARGAPNYAVVRDTDGTVVHRFHAADRSEALGIKHDFVQMQGWGQRDYSLRDESESTAAPREYEIFADTDPFTVVRSFYAADDQAAQAILDRYRQDHPGTYYRAHRAPIPGSTLDLQRQRAAAAQQQQGNWGIWMLGADRFANQPGEYPRGATPPMYRFPSREAAEQWIEQQRAERPRMRTDIEVREIEPREPLPDLFPELPGTPAAQQGSVVNYELYNRLTDEVIDTFPARNDNEAMTRLNDYRQFGAGQSSPDHFGVRRGPGVDNTAQPSSERSSYELYRISDGRTVTAPAGNPIVFRATSPEDAESKIARYAADFNLGAPELFAVRSVLQVPAQQSDAAQGGIVDVAGETPATTGQFTGEWKIVDPNGNEIYRFSGVGNAQSDANRVAMQWLQRNPRQMVAGVEVLPVMG